MAAKKSQLKRPRHAMPGFVKRALEGRGLTTAYRQRPAYQRNDYIGWIRGAQREETKKKRLRQMLEELDRGGVYMKMAHSPSRRARRGS
jgi:predicted unusual protein kinase regulating ubiquinone biosynthesis (AarF/ABC1/UbiB family)